MVVRGPASSLGWQNERDMPETLNDLIENFSLFEDWEERYRYLIDMGRKLPAMDEGLKTEENLVRGCTSRVWMDADTSGGILHFTADSDAHIVRGLIALVIATYNGTPVARVRGIDMDLIFSELGLSDHLSPNRRNGFFAMVEKIKSM